METATGPMETVVDLPLAIVPFDILAWCSARFDGLRS